MTATPPESKFVKLVWFNGFSDFAHNKFFLQGNNKPVSSKARQIFYYAIVIKYVQAFDQPEIKLSENIAN